MKTIAIVGGGLSGLSAAFKLKECILNHLDSSTHSNYNIIIIESQQRLGGRLLGDKRVDLGAAWIWPSNDAELLGLMGKLGIEKETQYCQGVALHESQYRGGSMINPMGFDISPAGDGSYRINQSAASMINRIQTLLNPNIVEIRLSTSVTSITDLSAGTGHGVDSINSNNDRSTSILLETINTSEISNHWTSTLSSSSSQIIADYVICALPPKLIIQSIQFSPCLPSEKVLKMTQTPVWMANSAKIGFIYNRPFWREKGNKTGRGLLSGTVFSECGPLQQIWDNSSSTSTSSTISNASDDNLDTAESTSAPVYALVGFLFNEQTQLLRNKTSDDIRDLKTSVIMQQMVRLFGEEALQPLHIVVKSWSSSPSSSLSSSSSNNNSSISNKCIDYNYPMKSSSVGTTTTQMAAVSESSTIDPTKGTSDSTTDNNPTSNSSGSLFSIPTTTTSTSVTTDNDDNITLKSIPFGHPLVYLPFGTHQQVQFAGTETAENQHGHMNGAVVAGHRAANQIIGMLRLSIQ